MITLRCTQCAAPLEVTADLDLFACGHCGATHQVQRSGGTVSLARVEEQLDAIKTHMDRQATQMDRQTSQLDRQTAELAIVRLQREIETLNTQANEAQRRVAVSSKARTDATLRWVLCLVIAAMFASCAGLGLLGGAEFAACAIISMIIPIILGIAGFIGIITASAKSRQARIDLGQYNQIVRAGRAKQAEYDKYDAILNPTSPPASR